MKFFSIIASLVTVFGCGIMSFIFDLPERYIERDVKTKELVGTWNITPESEVDVNNFIKKFPDWGGFAPWKTFTLNGDGSCSIEIYAAWLGDSYSNDEPTVKTTSCNWNLAKEENLSNKISPVVELSFSYSGSNGQMWSFYIYEENSKLILWSFIGDADDFRPQDFVKVEQ
jgi:hypothetical protein